MKDLVGHQFRREQPLENKAFGQGVDDAHKLIRRHGKVFFCGHRAKPFFAESITLRSELGYPGAQFLMRERVGQTGQATDCGRPSVGDGGERGVRQGTHDFGEGRVGLHFRLDRSPISLSKREK